MNAGMNKTSAGTDGTLSQSWPQYLDGQSFYTFRELAGFVLSQYAPLDF
jgi:hypothetical protein